jgi:hypothetical protein
VTGAGAPAEEIGVRRAGQLVVEPAAARVWNYWLGGKDNYAVDRSRMISRRHGSKPTTVR